MTLVKLSGRKTKWGSLPAMEFEGSFEDFRSVLPQFERRTFSLAMLPLEARDLGPLFCDRATLAGMNRFHDVIVRMPLSREARQPIPVGLVSRQYSLVQHVSLLEEVEKALERGKVDIDQVQARICLTEYGERMRLSVVLPKEYNLEVSEKDSMGLRLELFNSVDGGMRFMAVLGWLRFVCSNGMVLGTADTYLREKHDHRLQMTDISTLLNEGIEATTSERKNYRKWRARRVDSGKFEAWVNTSLAKQWGVKAAARAWHITTSGHDVALADVFEKGMATDKSVEKLGPVPGAVLPGDNAYAVSQALSWLAKERRDVQEQLEWKRQIPDLMKGLLRRQ